MPTGLTTSPAHAGRTARVGRIQRELKAANRQRYESVEVVVERQPWDRAQRKREAQSALGRLTQFAISCEYAEGHNFDDDVRRVGEYIRTDGITS